MFQQTASYINNGQSLIRISYPVHHSTLNNKNNLFSLLNVAESP